MYTVKISKSAQKDLDKLPDRDFEFVDKRIQTLATDPRPRGCVKLKGSKTDFYRVRQGRFRIIYEIFDAELIVNVIEVADRKEVYR
ncbi:MAG: type II toxin-antitoxin system RelE/ParE family toxin [Ignavibacteriae bacterium]|nr:type II toxin-antitoxin system RelE/ParE family toxin [Ignavibacteriota bacterium]